MPTSFPAQLPTIAFAISVAAFFTLFFSHCVVVLEAVVRSQLSRPARRPFPMAVAAVLLAQALPLVAFLLTGWLGLPFGMAANVALTLVGLIVAIRLVYNLSVSRAFSVGLVAFLAINASMLGYVVPAIGCIVSLCIVCGAGFREWSRRRTQRLFDAVR